MREILFRAKSADNYPYPSRWERGVPFEDSYGSYMMKTSYGLIEVKKETVGEYTGLTDKNGVKIFEGDILSSDRYPYTSDGSQNYFAEVVWFDNCPAFGLFIFKAPKSLVRGVAEGTEFIEDDLSDMEVIGNIYDNPELVGDDDNDEPTEVHNQTQ